MTIVAEPGTRRPYTLDEFHRLRELGILLPDHVARLRDGEIWSSPGPYREAPPDEARHRFTYADYYLMCEGGILDWAERVELWDGDIVLMERMEPRRISSAHACLDALLPLYDECCIQLSANLPIHLEEHTCIKADLAVVRRPSLHDDHPLAYDIHLMALVSDRGTRDELRGRLLACARAEVPETWLLDTGTQTIEVHRDLRDGEYCSVHEVGMGDTLAPAEFPNCIVAVKDVFRW